MIADRALADTITLRARDACGDLVSVLVIVKRADGTQMTAGLLSFTSEEWHAWIRQEIAGPRVRVDDASTFTSRDRYRERTAADEDGRK